MKVRTKILVAQLPLAIALLVIVVAMMPRAEWTVSQLLFAVAALAAGGCVSAFVGHRALQPLALLTRTVQQIGDGDFSARVQVAGRDELAQLARHVNATAARLGEYRRSSLGDLLLAQQAAQATIDSLPDPVVVFDRNRSVLNVNRAAETLLGLGAEQLDHDALDGVAASVRSALQSAREYVLSGRGTYVATNREEALRIATPEGEQQFLARAAPLCGDDGAIAGATVVLQDVTRVRRADELRNNLVATAAHELLTPLTSLRMAIHLCLEGIAGPLNDRQADLLYAGRDDCDRLQSITDELLHLARVEGAPIHLDQRPTSVATLVDAAVGTYLDAAAKHHVLLEAAVSLGLPDVNADRERMQFVLATVLGAVIHHAPPHARIRVTAVQAERDVRVEVNDPGGCALPGATGGDVPLGASARAMSVAKEIVEAHGGAMGGTAGSGGNIVWFTLRASEPRGAPADPTTWH